MHYWNDYQRAVEVGRTFRSYMVQPWSRQVSFVQVPQDCVKLLWTSARLESPYPVLAIGSYIWLLLPSNTVASLSLIDWPFSLQHRPTLHLSYIFPALSGWSVFSTGEKESLEGSSTSASCWGFSSLHSRVTEQSCCVPEEWVNAGGWCLGGSQCSSLLWGMYFQGGSEHELLTQRQEGDRQWCEGDIDQQQEKTWGLVAEGVGVGMEVF